VTLARIDSLGSLTAAPDWGGLAPHLPGAAARRRHRRPWETLAVDLIGSGLAAGLLLPLRLGAGLTLCWLSLLVLGGSYLPAALPRTRGIRVPVRMAVVLALAVDLVGARAWPDQRRDLLLTVAVALATAIAGRLALGRDSASGRAALGRVVVAGDQPGVRRALAELERGRRGRVEVVATCLFPGEGSGAGAALGQPSHEHVVDLVRMHHAAAVVAVPSGSLTPAVIRRLTWDLESVGAELLVSLGLCDVAPVRTTVALAGTSTLLHVRPAELHGPRRILKDAWERAAALVLLVALAPLLLVLLVTIRIDSRGPALFRQTRLGRGEAPFTMLKLRTMTDGAERCVTVLRAANDADGVLFKIRADPRITRIGTFLRRYSLDELPQLWNVVRGEMSLVGPRPPLPGEVARYNCDVHRRMAVKPGLTGLWQVSGRSDLSWEDSVQLDLFYVDNWSLALDLSILLRTFAAVFGHAGAY
jgi:exopolysaccharide biosynthesis polyprenyl glycosylphosphotransferase